MQIQIKVSQRRINDKDQVYKDFFDYTFQVLKCDSIADQIHSAFDFHWYDVCGWPGYNIPKEEVDRLFAQGQRAFVLRDSYSEYVVFVRVFSDEEWWLKRSAEDAERLKEAKEKKEKETEKDKHDDFISDLLLYAKDVAGVGSNEPPYTMEDLREHLVGNKELVGKLMYGE